MATLRARCLNFAVRTAVRRRDWGDSERLARRARRVFGVPGAMSGFWTHGLEVRRIDVRGADGHAIRGEWLIPPDADPGSLLYVHGGGFVSCSAATHRPITASLARLMRRRVFSLDYRLAPEHPFPAAADDAFAAYRWLADQGGAAHPLLVAGDSAGGGLVLTTLVRARDARLRLPSRAVCFSPWADLSGAGASLTANDGECAMFRRQNIAAFANVYLRGARADDPRASPAFADLSGLPPVLIQVGDSELLLDDARTVHEKIRRTGGSSRLEVFEGVFHGWQMLTGFLPEARVALRQAAEFLGECDATLSPEFSAGHARPGSAS